LERIVGAGFPVPELVGDESVCVELEAPVDSLAMAVVLSDSSVVVLKDGLSEETEAYQN
jgi:hypothetical protein